ncbi:MAG: hypothetical protein ABIH25_03300 [Candidatus Woesearchaeota archaeon]
MEQITYDTPTWENCIGYVDKSRCECEISNLEGLNITCDYENVDILVEFERKE